MQVAGLRQEVVEEEEARWLECAGDWAVTRRSGRRRKCWPAVEELACRFMWCRLMAAGGKEEQVAAVAGGSQVGDTGSASTGGSLWG